MVDCELVRNGTCKIAATVHPSMCCRVECVCGRAVTVMEVRPGTSTGATGNGIICIAAFCCAVPVNDDMLSKRARSAP